MTQLLTPTMINENTQLGKVISLLKGLERYINAEDEKKKDFLLKKIECQQEPFTFIHESEGLLLVLNFLR